MTIFVNNVDGENASWVTALGLQLPDQNVVLYDDIEDKNMVEYAVVWNHPHGDLATFPNLKAVLILGAGTDYLDQDNSLPKVPYVRLIDPDVGIGMAHYALYWTMHFHRRYEKYRQQAPDKTWARYEMPRSQDYKVTILGLGRIGSYIAEQLAANGFATRAWNRSAKQYADIDCYSGETGLHAALAETDVLVNCLPLNSSTQGMLNIDVLGRLPKGANLVNPSRGAVIDDDALIALLQNGHIAAAALDTFAEEPLPHASPYWALDNVFITPHMSGATYAKSAAIVVADNIKRIEKGEEPFPIHHPPEKCHD